MCHMRTAPYGVGRPRKGKKMATSTPRLRRPLTLSDMEPELELWVRQEALRRKALGLPRTAFYEVVNDGVRALRDQTKPGYQVYYLQDGRGPYLTVLECLDALGVPKGGRGVYWYRRDRLPKEYADQIEIRPAPQGEESAAPTVAAFVLDDSEQRLGAWQAIQGFLLQKVVTQTEVVTWLKREADLTIGLQHLDQEAPPEGIPTGVLARLHGALAQRQLQLGDPA